ncbi:hypothetical protein CJ030_MR4G023053 [Morella rubra]|uniref:Uncharacterized protein n=1 Tax=Morella rubra TaxID=262757 RepID=A0A6A1VUA0_9ROSI|nr:hypothetical protein CJ030_MR4G023053 [Morella rubra]
MLGEDTTILDGSYLIHGQLRPFLRIMHLILCSTIDPNRHTTELSFGRAEFMYLVVVRRLPVDMTSYIYQFVRAQISLPYKVLLIEFLQAMMVLEGSDESKAVPLGATNKTMLLKLLAWTR